MSDALSAGLWIGRARPDAAESRLGVVVVTFNSERLLPDLFESFKAGLADVGETQVVVVDNDSGDASVARARGLCPEALVVETGRNGGYSAGINAGVQALGPGYDAVLVLNPDVRLGPGCARTLLDALGVGPVGIAAPRLVDARGELIHSQRRDPTVLRLLADVVLGATRAGRLHPWLGEVVTEPRAYDVAARPDWVEGSTLMISAACLESTMPWEESYFLYSEETDFALRARDDGFAVAYVPEAEAVHLEGGSSIAPEHWALLTANRLRLFRRRHGHLAGSLFHLLLIAREGSRAALGRSTSRAALRVLLNRRALAAPRGPEWLRTG